MDDFERTNANGEPKTCKFCHSEIWWHLDEKKFYDVGGQVIHNCEGKQQHYRARALDRAESRRQRRRR